MNFATDQSVQPARAKFVAFARSMHRGEPLTTVYQGMPGRLELWWGPEVEIAAGDRVAFVPTPLGPAYEAVTRDRPAPQETTITWKAPA